jgi:TPR repeat protein
MIKFFLSLIFFNVAFGKVDEKLILKKDFNDAINMINSEPKKANLILAKIADKGYAPAIKALADSYVSGDGVEKNIMQALFLYMKAADLNYGPAQFCAGALLQNGSLGFVNLSLSFYYFCLACINEELDEIKEDACVYRDVIDKKLTADQKQAVYKQVCDFFNKRSEK